MMQGTTRRCLAAALPVLLAIAGCRSPDHETGEVYGVSDAFDGHVGEHMPLVFAKDRGEPWIVLTLCRRTAETGRPEMATYNIHVTILSGKDEYDLEDNRLEFIADGRRISLARAGAAEAAAGEHGANYPVALEDLEALASAGGATVRINTAGSRMTRGLDQEHLAAVDEFYMACVEQGARHAGAGD